MRYWVLGGFGGLTWDFVQEFRNLFLYVIDFWLVMAQLRDGILGNNLAR